MSSSATSSATLQRGKRIPDWTLQDVEGIQHTLWDYRQKSHVVLIYDPDRKTDQVQHWKAAIEADRKQWDWLNVKILLVDQPPKGMEPGIYAIDRYGIFMNRYPTTQWNFDMLERDYLYYEAYHC